jgi:alpha-glucosidase
MKESRLHVKIFDAGEQAYQVPESVFPRPKGDGVDSSKSALVFSYTNNPFSFQVRRGSTNETLFDTSAASLIFENQYLRLRTSLPESPYLYGLGEHTDPFRLNTTNYTRTVSAHELTVNNYFLTTVAMEPRRLWSTHWFQFVWSSPHLF